MPRHVLAAALPFVALLASPAAAQDVAGSAYLRFGAGWSSIGDLDQSLDYNPEIAFVQPPPSTRSTALSDAIAFVAAAGFDYPAGTRTELEYRHVLARIDSLVETAPISGASHVAASDRFTVQTLMSNVYRDFGLSSGLSVYLGAGVGGAFVGNGLGERDAAFAWQGKAGFEVDLGGGLSAGLDYARLWSRDLAFGPENFTPAGPPGPRADGDGLALSQATFSLRKTF